MANINKIRLSGQTYNIEDSNAPKTVELTQAQYDALAVKDPNTFYIITDAQGADLSQYYTSAQTESAITQAVSGKVDTSTFNTYSGSVDTALSGKQDTLTAGTNITIVDNVISATGGGGDVTVDTSLDSGSTNPVANSAITNTLYTAANANGDGNGYVGNIEAKDDTTYLDRLIWGFKATRYKRPLGGSNSNDTQGVSFYCSSINGVRTVSKNYQNVGHFSLVETSAITTSVTSSSTDAQVPSAKAVYDALQEGGGGSSYTAGDGIDITNAVISVTGKVDTTTYETYTAATATAIGDKLAVSDFNTYSGTVDTAINSKASQSDLSTLSGTVTAHTANTDIHVTTAQTAAWDAKSNFSGSYNDLTDKPTIPTVPTSNTAFTNDAGYITSDAISGKADTSAVTESITAAVSGKVDTSTYETYTAATDTALASKADTATTYTKAETMDFLTRKADAATTYTKAEVDTAIQDSLSGYVTTDTLQNITVQKTFVGDPNNTKKSIKFKQYDNASKVGFVVVNSAETNNEVASFEFRPNTFTIDNVQHPLLYFGHYRNTNIANAGVSQTVIGFRQYDQKNAAAYHYLIPLPEKAKTPFGLTTSFKDYYAPIGFKNGSTMVTADETGVVDLSSEFGGKVDTSTFNTYSGSVETALSGKQDTLSAGAGIEISGNVISATGGGGKAVSAGTNISITTGETADTVSCTLPITLTKQKTSIHGDNDNLTIFNLNKTNEINHTGTTDNIIIGNNNKIGNAFDPSKCNFIFGDYNTLNQGFGGKNSSYNFIVGEYNTIGKNYSENASHTALFGTYLTPKNSYEYAFGKYNNSVSGSSTFGDSGNTLFSVGNGTADNARHNALEIRQNGDIYLNDGSKLQDTVSATTANTTALGGLKLVKLTQSEYDGLSTKDSNTLYVIVN